ncbi:hypothetical protein L484_015576 [Morus notabilis]|uniref:Zonadhesin n=1 Tax=Morus notabilis TaxID=981085 RepID=W9S2V4_9ROSA|nr:zonadhesin [Morus notabilis]EXC23666.1 hypothetical protein L484_015576 [Morus notabilis]
MQAKGRERSLSEKDEELSLFFEMRRREKENESNNNLLLSSEELPPPQETNNNENSPISRSAPSLPLQRKSRVDEFLNSENEKSDYDWLLTPPGTPLFNLEMESRTTATSQQEFPTTRPIALRSRPANIQVEPASRRTTASKNLTLNSELKSSTTIGNRRPSSSEGHKPVTRRSATPTARPTLPSTTKPSRSSTPSLRPSLPSIKHVVPPMRSSTPTRSSARSSTPTARPSVPAAKSATRSATPTRQTSTPLSAHGVSAPAGRASSASKIRPANTNSSAPSRGPSPTVKSRPWKPSEMPGFSLDVPANLRTTLTERPASASRGRPVVPSVKSSSTATGSSGKLRQQSCSPSRARALKSSVTSTGNSNRAMSKSRCNDIDEVSPVVIGTQMVERVVNMRKLAPPKREDDHSNNNSAGKSLFSDSLGFGRTLSKKSLDMALRHMDIRRSMQGNLRPVVTSIPVSSMYSIRSGGTKNRATSNSDSPLATSSNASSEPSVNNAFTCLDGSDAEVNDARSAQGN